MSDEPSRRGFWGSVPGILTAAAAIITAVAGLVAALSQAGLLDGPGASPSETAAPLTGRWTAQVDYPWNVSRRETFSLRVEDGRVLGMATYLGVPRSIEEGRVEGDRLSFVTRVEEILGGERRAYENRYDGLISLRGINFVLQDSRGIGPIEFTARREE